LRSFAKLCDVRDWDDAELLRVLREERLEVRWPHVILKASRSLFTSVALPLRKPL
jgi:hypothetical protein